MLYDQNISGFPKRSSDAAVDVIPQVSITPALVVVFCASRNIWTICLSVLQCRAIPGSIRASGLQTVSVVMLLRRYDALCFSTTGLLVVVLVLALMEQCHLQGVGVLQIVFMRQQLAITVFWHAPRFVFFLALHCISLYNQLCVWSCGPHWRRNIK